MLIRRPFFAARVVFFLVVDLAALAARAIGRKCDTKNQSSLMKNRIFRIDSPCRDTGARL